MEASHKKHRPQIKVGKDTEEEEEEEEEEEYVNSFSTYSMYSYKFVNLLESEHSIHHYHVISTPRRCPASRISLKGIYAFIAKTPLQSRVRRATL